MSSVNSILALDYLLKTLLAMTILSPFASHTRLSSSFFVSYKSYSMPSPPRRDKNSFKVLPPAPAAAIARAIYMEAGEKTKFLESDN